MPRSRWGIGTDCFLVLIRNWRNGKAVLNLYLEIRVWFFPPCVIKGKSEKDLKLIFILKVPA